MPWRGFPLSKIAEAEAEVIRDKVHLMALDAFTVITKAMPVDTGAARGSTNVSEGAADLSYIDPPPKTKKNAYPPPAAPSLPDKLWPTIYVTNAVPYIGVLEEGGHSKQGSGMFKSAVALIRAKYGQL